jgi:Domain of unknown function (DUF4234)
MAAVAAHGPVGKRRGVVFVLLITLVTLGIYSLYWVYKTQQEIKDYSGDGLGGVLGLVIWILISPVSAFVIPSEIGTNLFARAGRERPVTGWTGLWLFPFGVFLIPAIVWFVKVQGSLNRFWESAGTATATPAAPAMPAEPSV